MRGHRGRTAWRVGWRRPADHLILTRIPDRTFAGLIAAFPSAAGSDAGVSRDPHITLFGPFFPEGSVGKVLEIIGRSLSGAGSLTCRESDLVRLKGRKGGAIALGIIPCDDLSGFYRDLVGMIPPLIRSCSWIDRPPGNRLFHISLRFNIPFRLFDSLWEKAAALQESARNKSHSREAAGPPLTICSAPVTLFRVAIIRRGSLWREYDIPRQAWLSRGEAYSPEGWIGTRECYRRQAGYELCAIAYRDARSQFVASDLHLGHAAIIDSCRRPFSSCSEMDRVLIGNWNYTVRPGDKVFYLGDHGPGDCPPPLVCCREQLQGDVTLIGNVAGFRIIHQGIPFTVVHDPRPGPLPEGWMLHGHVQGYTGEILPFFHGKRRSVNISPELVNYAPLSLDEICRFIQRAGPEEQIPTLNEARHRYPGS